MISEELFDNLKAAALCFFFAPIIWFSGAPAIAIAAATAGVMILFIPPLVLEHVNHGASARFFRLLLGGCLVIVVSAGAVTGAYRYQQCESYTGSFDFTTFSCN